MLESPKEAVDFPRKENQQFCNNVFYQVFFWQLIIKWLITLKCVITPTKVHSEPGKTLISLWKATACWCHV